jgi:hypothetical protein
MRLLQGPTMSERSLLILIRLTALLIVVCGIPLLWRVMMRLSWPVDCAIAAAASVLFAYTFERQAVR